MENTDRYSISVLEEAKNIQRKKGDDYNNQISRVSQADYYPRGVSTILDIAMGKVLRMYSVLESMEHGTSANFESVEDSAIDLINYASFIVAYMRGEVPGQDRDKDIFNRMGQQNPALIPNKFRT